MFLFPFVPPDPTSLARRRQYGLINIGRSCQYWFDKYILFSMFPYFHSVHWNLIRKISCGSRNGWISSPVSMVSASVWLQRARSSLRFVVLCAYLQIRNLWIKTLTTLNNKSFICTYNSLRMDFNLTYSRFLQCNGQKCKILSSEAISCRPYYFSERIGFGSRQCNFTRQWKIIVLMIEKSMHINAFLREALQIHDEVISYV